MSTTSQRQPIADPAGTDRSGGPVGTGASSWRILSPWPVAAAIFVACVAAVIGSAWDVIALTAETWYVSDTYNHCMLIVPICLYLVWTDRDRLTDLAPDPFLWGLIAVAAGLVGRLAGVAGGVIAVEQFSIVLTIQALFVTIFGWRISRRLWFSLAYLLFAVPFGSFLIPHLQDVTTNIAVWAARLVGIPTYQDGVFIYIPTGSFVVAEACSGVKYMIATVALGALFAHMTYRTWWRGLIFMMMAFITPVIANSIRAGTIVIVAHISGFKVGVGLDHIVFGWFLFAATTFGLFLVGMTFRDAPKEPATPASADTVVPRTAWMRCAAAGIVALLLTFSSGVYAERIVTPSTGKFAAPLAVPATADGWTLAETHADDWKPAFPGASTLLVRTYVKDRQKVRVAIAYYLNQEQGREIVSFFNNVVGHEVWRRVTDGSADLDLDGANTSVSTVRMAKPDQARIVAHWYWVDGAFTGSPYIAKLLEAKAKLFSQDPAAAVIMIAAEFDQKPGDAVKLLQGFVQSVRSFRPSLQNAGG